jgi:hypothetical protein
MTAQETIKAAYERLADEHNEDPRGPLMLALSRLIDAAGDVPTGDIELTALVGPDGMAEVKDQHGRRVAAVKSVAVFRDPSGPVFQVNL